MKKYLLTSILVFGICALPTLAFAESQNMNFLKGGYIAIGAGKSYPSSKVEYLNPDYSAEIYSKKRLKESNLYKIAIGGTLANNFRGELEFLYGDKYKFKHTGSFANLPTSLTFKTDHKTLFLNGYYDFAKINSVIKPYIGVGIGASKNSVSRSDVFYGPLYTSVSKKETTSFAWNANLGVMVDLSKNVYLDVSYKYMDLGKIKSGNTQLVNNVPFTLDKFIYGKLRTNVFLISLGLKFN